MRVVALPWQVWIGWGLGLLFVDMKRSHPDNELARRVEIDVGGTKIYTTVATLERSSYLSGMVGVAAFDDSPDSTARLFLDRDPEIFSLVLRLMRQYPHAAGLMPSDHRLCASVIAEADFLGFDTLVNHVKATAYYNDRQPEEDFPTFNRFETHLSRKEQIQRVAEIHEHFRSKDESYAVEMFSRVYGSIADALSSGLLPSRYLELKPKLKPSAKIVQVIPLDARHWFLAGDKYDEQAGFDSDAGMKPFCEIIEHPNFVRRVAYYALVEDENGARWTEAMLHLSPLDQQWCFFEDGAAFHGESNVPTYEANLGNLPSNLGDVSLAGITRNAGQRTMLASEWVSKFVVERFAPAPFKPGMTSLRKEDVWTHLLPAQDPPGEHKLSRLWR